ncbi:MAG: CDP-glucose 4,6-dehydratase [Longimicrobiales bacterium]
MFRPFLPRSRSSVTRIDHGFWLGKRVLLTGHTGFKGSWLSLWLERLGATVTGLALEPPSSPSLFEGASVAEGMTSVIGDVRDIDTVRAVFDQSDPEVVIHLAAQSLVHAAYDDPLDTYSTNVMGTANVLDAARDRSALRSVVMITSDKCYRNYEWDRGYHESDELGGRDPYSASKGAAELVIRSYAASWFPEGGQTAVASARAGNVIGGGDWAANRLVPDIMRAVAAGEPVMIRNPHALRPWQHVLEPLSGYLLLAERLWSDPVQTAGSWNLGPDAEQTKPVDWIVDRITTLWGDGATWSLDGNEFPHEDTYLRLDSSKIKSAFGWQPAFGTEVALEWIVEWYKAAHRGDDLRVVTLKQIEDYVALRRSMEGSGVA